MLWEATYFKGNEPVLGRNLLGSYPNTGKSALSTGDITFSGAAGSVYHVR